MPVSGDLLSSYGRVLFGYTSESGPFPSGEPISVHTPEGTIVASLRHWDVPRSANWVDRWAKKHGVCGIALVLDPEPLEGLDLSRALVDEN